MQWFPLQAKEVVQPIPSEMQLKVRILLAEKKLEFVKMGRGQTLT